MNTGSINTYNQLCSIENENIKYVTSSNGTIVICSEFYDSVNNLVIANYRLKGTNQDCALFSLEGYYTSAAFLTNNLLLCSVQRQDDNTVGKIIKINTNNGTVEGEIIGLGQLSFTSDGEKVYLFDDSLKKYDLSTFEEEWDVPYNYIYNEGFYPFEGEFYQDRLLIHTGFQQPSPYNTGIAVLNKNTGNVIEDNTSTDFMSDLIMNMSIAHPEANNFNATSINMDLEQRVILITTYDLATSNHYLIYTNFQSELLKVIKIPYPAKKIFFRP